MFYDLKLFKRQESNRIGMAWIAANRGISQMRKIFGQEKLNEFNVVTASEEILEYLTNNSENVKERFSLRLSVFLIRGTTMILQEQASKLFDDVVNFLQHVNKPIIIETPSSSQETTSTGGTGQFKIPLTPTILNKPKKKKPVRRRTEQEVARIQATDDMAQLDEIIAKKEDEMSKAPPVVMDKNLLEIKDPVSLRVQSTDYDDFNNNLGVLPLDKTKSSQLKQIEEHLRTEIIEKDNGSSSLKESSMKKLSPLSIEEISGQITVVAMVHRQLEDSPRGIKSKELEIEVPKDDEKVDVQKETEKHTDLEKIEEIETVPLEIGRIENIETIEKIETIKKKKETTPKVRLIFEMKEPKVKKYLYLNDPNNIYEFKEQFSCLIYNKKDLISTSELRDEIHKQCGSEALEILRSEEQMRTLETSKEISLKERKSSVSVMRTSSIAHDEDSTSKLGTKMSLQEKSPTLEPPFQVDQEIPPVETAIEDIFVEEKQDKETSPIIDDKIEEKQRRQILFKKIKMWDKKDRILTIDKLIPLPRNKLNAARTFIDSLHLSKDGFIKLTQDLKTMDINVELCT